MAPFRRAVVVLSLLCALGLSAMEGKDLILLRGRLDDIKSVPDELQDPIYELAAWSINDFDVKRSLIGSMGANHFEVEIKMHTAPRAERLRDMYVLGVKNAAGRLKVIYWEYAFRGVCIPDDFMHTYSLTETIAHLRQTGLLKWRPDCGE